MQKIFFIGFQFLLISYSTFAQNLYPTDYFRSPIDNSISLAGNFGEIRSNHFHAGFDIRTNGHEGMTVYAAADGYISRIKISPYGYGNTLYITHSNGFTSVYAHLQSFNETIQAYTKKIQYNIESFEIDTVIAPNTLAVKKGNIIALSGNSGGSEAPHLHFEIRDTKTEAAINPYYFGFLVDDNIKPTITKIAVYPLTDNAIINGKNQMKRMIPIYTNGKYSLTKVDTLTVSGPIGFGIECYDKETKPAGKNSIYSIELQSGGKRIFYSELEQILFENTRYVNTYVDFAEKENRNSKIQKSFLSKNNKLRIYKSVANNGAINFTDDSVHWVRYIVKDFKGNTSELMMKVQSTSNIKNKTLAKIMNPAFDCLKDNEYKNEGIQIMIPAYSLYDDLRFSYSVSQKKRDTYSPLHHVQNAETALQKAITLSIKAIDLPNNLQSKACIIIIDKKGKQNYDGGNYKDGWVITQTKNFGNFAIVIDTIAPKIKPNFNMADKTNINFSGIKSIGFNIKDDLSGIKKYSATIDNKWVLCEYDAKRNLLSYTFDGQVKPGKHLFNMEVSDEKNNTSSFSFSFLR